MLSSEKQEQKAKSNPFTSSQSSEIDTKIIKVMETSAVLGVCTMQEDSSGLGYLGDKSLNLVLKNEQIFLKWRG